MSQYREDPKTEIVKRMIEKYDMKCTNEEEFLEEVVDLLRFKIRLSKEEHQCVFSIASSCRDSKIHRTVLNALVNSIESLEEHN